MVSAVAYVLHTPSPCADDKTGAEAVVAVAVAVHFHRDEGADRRHTQLNIVTASHSHTEGCRRPRGTSSISRRSHRSSARPSTRSGELTPALPDEYQGVADVSHDSGGPAAVWASAAALGATRMRPAGT